MAGFFELINKDRIIYRADNSLWSEKNRTGMWMVVPPWIYAAALIL
jgi:hypothetical protein